MTCLKDILEIVYYIAFIVLTFLIVLYAKKTYSFQTKSESTLFCKLYVPTAELGFVEQLVCLEVYNYGNRTARNVTINIGAKKVATVDYIKPNESAALPIGEVLRMMGCNRVFIQAQEIHADTITITIGVDGKEIPFEVSTTALTLRSEVLHNEPEVVARTLQDINKTLGKAFDCHHVGPGHNSFRDELCEIARNIKGNKS